MIQRFHPFLVLWMLAILALSVAAWGACGVALVVLDVQNYPLREWPPWRTANDEYVVDAIARVLDFARSAGIPVIYVQEIFPFTDLSPDLELTEDQAFPDEIAPTATDPIFRKSGQDAFGSGALLPHLSDEGIETLLFCGISSSSCLQVSANTAVTLGFDVTIVGDAHSDIPGVPSNVALWNSRFVKRMGIPVLMSDDIDWESYGCAQGGGG
jgi:nicotinamidase-related amidase